MYTNLYIPVYTRCIHGETILASESERKVDLEKGHLGEYKVDGRL